jgi:two-component sensor histidine kinase
MQLDVASVIITDELQHRRVLRPGLFREVLPFGNLTRKMVDDPNQVLPLLVDSALELCGAVSGGISLYEPEPAPGVFKWHHLRGDLEKFTGATTPRHYSPCGITLDRRSPILVQRPERVYSWLQEANLSLPECLLVPLYIGADEPLGTLWIVSEREGEFDGRHADALTDLAGFAGLALRMAADQQRLNEALDAQRMLAREMAHRLKNVLAVIEGLLHMATRPGGSARDVAMRLSGSLQALATAQALVTPSDVDAAASKETSLQQLLEAILAPYKHAQCTIGGPDVALGPEAKEVLALVFHELATNAAKYGALSSHDGEVSVRWQHTASALVIEWQEADGPPIATSPTRKGFGTVLATKSLHGLNGAISFSWSEQGLSAKIELPAAALARQRVLH